MYLTILTKQSNSSINSTYSLASLEATDVFGAVLTWIVEGSYKYSRVHKIQFYEANVFDISYVATGLSITSRTDSYYFEIDQENQGNFKYPINQNPKNLVTFITHPNKAIRQIANNLLQQPLPFKISPLPPSEEEYMAKLKCALKQTKKSLKKFKTIKAANYS